MEHLSLKKPILLSLIAGLILTSLSILYYTPSGQPADCKGYCGAFSPFNKMGFPLPFYETVNVSYGNQQPNYSIGPAIIDYIFWSVVSLVLIYLILIITKKSTKK